MKKPSEMTADEIEEHFDELIRQDPQMEHVLRRMMAPHGAAAARALFEISRQDKDPGARDTALASLRARGLDPASDVDTMTDDQITAILERNTKNSGDMQ